FEVVQDGQEGGGGAGPLDGPLPLQFPGGARAEVVEVGGRAPPAVLEFPQLGGVLLLLGGCGATAGRVGAGSLVRVGPRPVRRARGRKLPSRRAYGALRSLAGRVRHGRVGLPGVDRHDGSSVLVELGIDDVVVPAAARGAAGGVLVGTARGGAAVMGRQS